MKVRHSTFLIEAEVKVIATNRKKETLFKITVAMQKAVLEKTIRCFQQAPGPIPMHLRFCVKLQTLS